MIEIGIEQARADLGLLVNLAGIAGERFCITRSGKPAAMLVPLPAEADRDNIARAREVARALFASSSSSDRDRLAAGLLKELADRLDGPAPAQPAGARDAG